MSQSSWKHESPQPSPSLPLPGSQLPPRSLIHGLVAPNSSTAEAAAKGGGGCLWNKDPKKQQWDQSHSLKSWRNEHWFEKKKWFFFFTIHVDMQWNSMHSGISHLCTHILCSSGQHMSPKQPPPHYENPENPHQASPITKGEGEANTKTSTASNHHLLSIWGTVSLGVPLVTRSKENRKHTHTHTHTYTRRWRGLSAGSSFHSLSLFTRA